MRQRRRSLAWLLVLTLLLLAVAALVLLKYVFVVRNVQINGMRDVSDADLIRAAHIEFGSSILRIDEAGIQRGVNSLGTVRLDGIARVYPGTLILTVSERQPRAMLLYQGGIRLLDSECCVISNVDAVPDLGLVYINGMTVSGCATGVPVQAGPGQTEACCVIMQALLDNNAFDYITDINVSDVRSLSLITRTGITVKLGNADNMAGKIAWMRSTVADLQVRNEGGGTLDVSSGTKADYSPPSVQAIATPTAVPQLPQVTPQA